MGFSYIVRLAEIDQMFGEAFASLRLEISKHHDPRTIELSKVEEPGCRRRRG